jgi:hypothetical protein
MTRRPTGPRIGPKRTASGELTIWTRQIAGRFLMFWAFADHVDIYDVGGAGHIPNHIRTLTKETT